MKDYDMEIDELRKEIADLRALIENWAAPRRPKPSQGENGGRVEIMRNMHPDKRLAEMMTELCEKTEDSDSTGRIIYLGVFCSGGKQSNWIKKGVSCDDLIDLAESGMVEKVLACIGNPVKIKILTEILKGPKSVSELTEVCSLSSTGQAYHHMKPLLAADLIAEDANKKGSYFFRPYRVQGLIMLLAGISDLIDSSCIESVWE